MIHSQSINAPNFPGMLPSRDSWLYKMKDGFQRSSTGRPKSAQPSLRHGTYTFDSGNLYNETNQSQDSLPQQRPHTAGLTRSSSRNEYPPMRALEGETAPVLLGTVRPKTAGSTLGRQSSAPVLAQSMMTTFGVKGKEPASLTRRQPSVPKFIEDEKLVCRVYAYFSEDRIWDYDAPLGVPTVEKEMYRKVVIYFYLYDQTVQIIEEKSQNTGISAGNFYKRAPLNRTDGEPLSLIDLTPGNSIQMLGQEFQVYDADVFTRDYFRREFNIIIPPKFNSPKEFRTDMGAPMSTGMGTNMAPSKTTFGTKSHDYVAQREGFEKIHKFLNFEGQVLRFQCVDVAALEPGTPLNPNSVFFPSHAKRFALSYYLSDDKIDLRIIKAHSGHTGGLEENMIILKKCRVSKNWREVRRGMPPNYYIPEDFICGEVVTIYGRELLLVSCDNFTRANYEDRGIFQREVPCVEHVVEEVPHPIPQLGDGFLAIGSHEDTLATVYGQSKPSKDLKKIQRNQSRTLRCLAKLLTPNTIDATRVFMITFYLEDDTLQIFEKEIRNSGVTGGVFLKRGKYVNDLPSDASDARFFKPTDIFFGNVVSINGNEMQIYEMDNLSLKFCETYPDEFPLFDTFQIVHRLMTKVVDMQLDLKIEFLKADKAKKTFLNRDNFVAILDSLGVSKELNDQEMLTMMRRFQEGDKYMYLEMCDLFSHVYYAQQHLGADNKSSTLFIDKLETFLHLARLRSVQWRRSLRKTPFSNEMFITLAALSKTFRKHGFILNPKTIRIVYDNYRVTSGAISPHIHMETLRRTSNIGEDKAETSNVGGKSIRSKKGSGGRVDIRSQSRFQATAGDDGEVSLNPIKQRRNFLMTSVLRKKGEPLVASIDTGVQVIDEAKVVIDFGKLCDDIYKCDWI